MTALSRAAVAIAAVLVREAVDCAQSKAVFKAARARAGLRAAPERGTRPAYRGRPYPVAGTPHFLMVPSQVRSPVSGSA